MTAVSISSPMAGGTSAQDARNRLDQGLGDLADHYTRLYGLLVRSLRPAPGGRVRGGEPNREPLNIPMLDVISTLETAVLDLEAEVRHAHGVRPAQVAGRPHRDRDGTGPDPRVVAACGWLRQALPALDDLWIDYMAGVVQGTPDGPGMLPVTRRLLGLSERPVRFERGCPMCGCLLLLAPRPSTGVVICTNPDCRDSEGRVHRWSAEDWSPYAAGVTG